MFLTRVNIRSFDVSGKRQVKVEFNTIKVVSVGDNVYNSTVSSESITLRKKDKLSFHLTEMKKNSIIFSYEYLDTKKEKMSEVDELVYYKVLGHFWFWFSLFFKKEVNKLIQMESAIVPQE